MGLHILTHQLRWGWALVGVSKVTWEGVVEHQSTLSILHSVALVGNINDIRLREAAIIDVQLNLCLTINTLGSVHGKLSWTNILLMGTLWHLSCGRLIEGGEETQVVIRDGLAHCEGDSCVVLGDNSDWGGWGDLWGL